MKVFTSPSSPYGRKVKLTVQLKGLGEQVEFVPLSADSGEVGQANPLSKIPVLVKGDGDAIYDSPVICEFLDAQVASPVLFPGEGNARWRTLTLGALGDGIVDAAILLVYEKRFRSEELRVASWVEMQQKKIDQALAFLESNPPTMGDTPLYGDVALACALGYLDFRHEGKWRNSHPKMVAWLDAFAAAVPAFAATAPPPA